MILLLWLEPFSASPSNRPPLRVMDVPTSRPTVQPQPRKTPATTLAASNPATTQAATAVIAPTPLPLFTSPAIKAIATALTRDAKPPANTRPAPSSRPPNTPVTLAAASYTWSVTRGREGFWRVGKTVEGVWWFISPENHLEFLNTVTTVQPYQLARDQRGIIFQSRDFDGTPNTPGNLRIWAERTLQRVYASGFKGLGAWCHPIFHDLPVPITRDLNIWASSPASAIRLYDPLWTPSADATIRKAIEPLRDSRWLIGYFLDNELDFSDATLGPGVYFDNLTPDNPNRRQVAVVLRALWPDVEAFNAAWNLQLKQWADLDQLKTLPKDPPETYSRLLSAWLEHIMRDYFKITTELLRKQDPNHLILGIRYAGHAPDEVIRASKGLTDVQSINYYVADALLDQPVFRAMTQLSDQPVILSEYSFHSLDGRSGNRNNIGFAAQVPDQRARADAYRLFTTRVARLPWMIGADWFQWSDEPPSGRSSDGEDVNFGVVDVDDHEYPLLANAIRGVSAQLNTLHRKSATDTTSDLWRDGFDQLPTQRVPYMPLPIRINGELSDWPDVARLRNVRMTQTVGMDRASLPGPKVYLGWRPEGLYIGMEVRDLNIIASPIAGRWWTRDMAEWWISTRPVSTDQTGYNAYCHQFMFVPTDPTMSHGIAGSVGQWHRPGDSLKDSLLPHPEIQYSCRLLHDRYVVEMLIPAASMHGWDPLQHPDITFNIHIRNYYGAAGYFWSAPKEVQTQLRPHTWGALYLEPPPVTAASDLGTKTIR